MFNVAMDPSQSASHTAGENSLTVVPNPSPETLLREQLDAVTVERDTLRTQNDKLNKELKEYDTALADLRAKLRAHEENTLAYTLANLDAGQVLRDAGDLLKTLCTTVQRRQKKGSLTLSLLVKPFQGTALVLVPDLKISEPKPEPARSVFFANEDGTLSRSDPNQREFNLGRSRMDDERFNPNLR